MLETIQDTHIYSFSKDHVPALTVRSGTVVRFHTLDCFSGAISSPGQTVEGIDYSRINPAAGPVRIEEAKPGDVLKVEILDIGLDGQGVVTSIPGIGTLEHTAQSAVRTVPIRNGKALFADGIELPIRPMIGVIGTAPAEGEIPCGHPGPHGGNLDANVLTSGAVLYLPVRAKGALFALGDLHAAMGDGEICGVGIEIAGYADVRLTVLKTASAPEWPIAIKDGSWYAIASNHELLTAVRLAAETMQKLIVQEWSLSKTDAYMLMGVAGDVQINQCCKPCAVESVVRFRMPQLEDRPTLFREG
ncbi:acetamidase/formamidase family protein [Cohnella algarum]|uniref:acetamidase/formamidase family protein n=1 Tax=Cohnella algarum TaxID=2044859 RepID=UPI001968285A|nr:acetamidase/formamidase family protein [Cohnella algarum]MBN2984425.1 acetamidase/formamidase family protein [Cohnella algarum]